MSATVRLPDNECELRDWRIDILGPNRMSLTVMATDGTSLMIDDVASARILRDACGEYLDQHRAREDATEDYAHELNALLAWPEFPVWQADGAL